jgi:ABC-type lipopolysaccharide export system ATPase subunit
MAGKGVLAELPDPTQAWRQLNLDALCRWQMLGVLFVDQSVERALACSDRIYAMDNGRMALTGSSAEVLSSELVRIIVGPVTAPATA